ncbi:MAG: hypothetical protein ACRCW9_01185 [Cetobacterium sp.]
MVKILKILYIIFSIAGMAVTGSNTLVLKDIGVKVSKLNSVPQVTSHSQIHIN